MSQVWILVLVVVAAAGIWFGFAEDFKIGVAGAVVALVAATFYAFHGGFRALEALPDYGTPSPKTAKQRRSMTPDDMASMKLATLIVVGMAVAAAGFWFAFAEDFKPALLIGVLAAAGATLASFRGKAAF